jgi:DNA-binding LytR/AlgR family response regulator
MIQYHKQTISELENRMASAQELSGTPVESQPKKEESRKTLLVNQGKGLVPLEVAQVAYIYTSQEMVLVKTLEGNVFTLDASLEQLEEQLSPYTFFRISRQFIVQKKAVKKVESESSGRLLLHLQPQPAGEVTVSRRRAPEFRQWLDT